MSHKFVLIGEDCYPFPLAKHLQDEGNEVIYGLVEDLSDMKVPNMNIDETPEDHKERISNYDGIIEKQDIKEVIAMLKEVPKNEQDDYFFFFDFNDMYKISEQILKMGFRNGLFPTEQYYNMEKDRKMSKEFVQKHYKEVKVADYELFDTIDEGIEYLDDHNDIFCLKSCGNSGRTFVPKQTISMKRVNKLKMHLKKKKINMKKADFFWKRK